MFAELEEIPYPHRVELIIRVIISDVLQYLDLYQRLVIELLLAPDNLQCAGRVLLVVNRLYHLPRIREAILTWNILVLPARRSLFR